MARQRKATSQQETLRVAMRAGMWAIQLNHKQRFPSYKTLEFDFVSTNRAHPEPNQCLHPLQQACRAIGLVEEDTGRRWFEGTHGCKSGDKWKKKAAASKAKMLLSPQALMAQKAKDDVEQAVSGVSEFRGLVYTEDGKITRKGVGLSEEDGIVLKLRGYIASEKCFFSCGQVARLLKMLPSSDTNPELSSKLRLDVIVATYARLCDSENFTFEIKNNLSHSEVSLLRRLGWLTFDPITLRVYTAESGAQRTGGYLLLVCVRTRSCYRKMLRLTAYLSQFRRPGLRDCPNMGDSY